MDKRERNLTRPSGPAAPTPHHSGNASDGLNPVAKPRSSTSTSTEPRSCPPGDFLPVILCPLGNERREAATVELRFSRRRTRAVRGLRGRPQPRRRRARAPPRGPQPARPARGPHRVGARESISGAYSGDRYPSVTCICVSAA